MRTITVEVDDNIDQEQVDSFCEAVSTGRGIVILRPDGLTNQQAGTFIVQAHFVLEGMVALSREQHQEILLDKPPKDDLVMRRRPHLLRAN